MNAKIIDVTSIGWISYDFDIREDRFHYWCDRQKDIRHVNCDAIIEISPFKCHTYSLDKKLYDNYSGLPWYKRLFTREYKYVKYVTGEEVTGTQIVLSTRETIYVSEDFETLKSMING